MVYVEFLRIRRSLMWHAGIISIVAIGIMLLGLNNVHTDVDINGTHQSASSMVAGMPIPLSVAAGIAAFFGAIFASACGASFNRESLTRDLSWTKPISRTLLALQFALVDLGGVLAAYLFAFLAIVVVMLRYHVAPYADGAFGVELALGVGIGTMWYALLQLITCMFGPAARAMQGVLWPIAFALAGITQIDGTVGRIARAIDVINPLSYMSSSSSTNGTHGDYAHVVASPMNAMPSSEKMLFVWFFTIAFTAIAVAIWPKKEA
jgi:hypothetical protein